MSQDFLAIPELVRLLSSHLLPPTLLNLVQVSRRWNQLFVPELWHTFDDSLYLLGSKVRPKKRLIAYPSITNLRELHTIRNWIRLIFKKYGQHIRVLKIRWDFVLEAASDAGVCTNLLTLELKQGKRKLWEDQPEHILQNPAAVKAASRATDRMDQGYAGNGGKFLARRARRAPKIIKNLPADLVIASHDYCRLESNWVMLQNIWNMVKLNPALRRLIIQTKGISFAESETARDYIEATLRRIKDLRELSATAFCGDEQLSRLEKYAPQIETLWTTVAPNLEQGHNLPVNRNIKSLTLNNYLSRTNVLTLLKLHPNLEYFSVSGPKHDTRPIECETPTFKLKTLHIGNDHSDTIKTTDLIDILRHCPDLKEIGLKRVDAPALEAIMTYCKSIEAVKALSNPRHVNRSFQGRPVMDAVNRFLVSCPTLKVLDVIEHCIHVDELLLQPWACHGLETFRCRIVGFARLNKEQQAVYDHVSAPGYNFRVGSRFHEYAGPITDTMEFTLESGLEQLARLKHLEIFGFEGTNHRIGKQELKWMAKQWPNLRVMRGLARDKLFYPLKQDEKKAALREYMRSLRPDVEQSSLFKGFV